LHQSEARYRNLFETASDSIFIVDQTTGYIIESNPAASILYGYSSEEFLRLKPRDVSAEPEKTEAAISGRITKILFRLHRRKDGTIFPVEISSSYFTQGERKMHTAFIRDISERKQIEEELLLEKENFRNSLDDSPLGVRIATTEGNTIYANKTILYFYGYDSIEELHKTPLKDRYTPQSYVQAQKRKHQRELGDFSANEYEISIIRKNGEIRHLQVFRKDVLWDGVRQFQVLYNDITVHKQAEAALIESEARFRTLFENSLMGISIADPEGCLIQVNQAYAQMYGYNNPKEILAEVSNVRHLYANPKDRKEVLQILRRNGFMEPRTLEVVRRDGSRFPVLVSACEIRDIDGKLIYNQATHIDITERRQTENEIKKSKELLEKLNIHLTEIREEERAKISREIHDQLGQSMTALKLDLNRMRKYINTNPEAVTKLESMIGLVSDTIKDVQRISSDLRPGILDELGLVSAIEWYCDEFEKRTGIKCNLKLDNSDYPDPQINLTFFRVLQETLTNVIRHAKASSVSIKLNQLKKGATMTIQDNGIGITKEQIESNKSLGLISMRERVKQFNGTVDISSKKSTGTKLIIFIPS
jgi:PAS domain S-box-containing protein